MVCQGSPSTLSSQQLAAVADPGPDRFLDELPGFPAPPDWASHWRHALAAWRETGRPLRALLLCGGVDGPGPALKCLGIPYKAEIWDIDPALEPALARAHRSCGELHVGPLSGDLLRVPVRCFRHANVVVAGPPCPPWSSLGVQESFKDPRAEVFLKVVDIIVHLAKQQRHRSCGKAFFMFILENVEGTMKRSRDDRAAGRDAPMVEVVKFLRDRLPPGWVLSIYPLETSDMGLPHKRRRIYVRALNAELLQMQRGPETALASAPAWQPHGGLGSILHLGLPPTNKRKAGHGNKYMQNLARYRKLMAAQMRDPALAGTYAVVDLSRNVTMSFGSLERHDNRCLCLTASNRALWVFALGAAPVDLSDDALPEVALPVDRWLHPVERAVLQGFQPDTHVAVRDAVRVFGNAMSVPVVGLLMAPVLEQAMHVRRKLA